MIVTNFSYGRKSGPGLDIVRFYPKKTAALKVQPSIAFLDFATPSPQPERFLRTHRRSRRKPQVTVRCVDTATAKKLRPARINPCPTPSSEFLVSLALTFFEIRSGARDHYRYDEFNAYSPPLAEAAF